MDRRITNRNETVRFNLYLSQSQYDALVRLKELSGCATLQETIRKAIAVFGKGDHSKLTLEKTMQVLMCASSRGKKKPVTSFGQDSGPTDYRETYVMTFTCPNCGERYTRRIPKGVPAHPGTCTNCGCGQSVRAKFNRGLMW